MATQVIGAVRRSRTSVALIVVALAFAAAVLVAQASSIWSSGTASHGQSVVQVSLSPQHFAKVGHIPAGCRPKYGCSGGSASGNP
jgi:hypothetical protein